MEDILIISLLDGRVVAVDSVTGMVLWSFDSGTPLVTATQTHGAPTGVTIFPDGTDGSLYAYRLLKGRSAKLEVTKLGGSLPRCEWLRLESCSGGGRLVLAVVSTTWP